MVTRIATLILLWGFSQLATADLQASVNSTSLQEGDTVVLTLTDTDGSGDQPDLSPLRQQFQILGTSSSQNHSIINGRRSSQVQWIVTLYPTNIGDITIPRLGQGSHQSQAITLSISKGDDNQTLPTAQSPIINSQLDKSQVYAGGQVLLTVRILHLGNMTSASLNPPELDNASVSQVHEASYQRIVNNSRVSVIERVYAIHPEQAGTIEIPGQLLQADMATRSQRSIFGSTSTKLVMRKSPAHELTVLALPSIAAGKETVTASDLTIRQEWNHPLHDLSVGDSITRSLIITATGAPSVAIPPIFEDRMNGIKQYQDQPVLDDQVGEKGITGIRKQSSAYVLTEPGEYELPAIILYWVNADTGKLQSASLPSQFIRVNGDAAPSVPIQTPVDDTGATTEPLSTNQAPQHAASPLWFWLTWVFAALWLTTLVAWLLVARSPQKTTTHTNTPQNQEKQLFDELLKASKANDAQAVLHLFNRWGRTLNPKLGNQQQICDYLGDDHIRKSIARADRHCYEANADHAWNGAQLVNHLTQVRKVLRQTDDEKLADIYPH